MLLAFPVFLPSLFSLARSSDEGQSDSFKVVNFEFLFADYF